MPLVLAEPGTSAPGLTSTGTATVADNALQMNDGPPPQRAARNNLADTMLSTESRVSVKEEFAHLADLFESDDEEYSLSTGESSSDSSDSDASSVASADDANALIRSQH
jgi:hypothetical protein